MQRPIWFLRPNKNVEGFVRTPLGELLRYMQENDRTLLVSEAREDAMRIFHSSGLVKSLGEDNILPDDPTNPTLATAKALKRAVAILGTKDADISIYARPKGSAEGE